MDNSDCKTESRFPVQKLALGLESKKFRYTIWSHNDHSNWWPPIIVKWTNKFEHPYPGGNCAQTL